MLVDESQNDCRDLIVLHLYNAGGAVTAVADGTSALASQTAQPCDVVILDRTMSGMDGLDGAWTCAKRCIYVQCLRRAAPHPS